MNRRLTSWVIALLLLVGSASAFAGEIIDRIVATVNGHVILQSDWDDAIRYEGLVDGRTVVELSAEDRKAALDRLIDQELLREQMHASDFQHATEEQIQKRLEEVRAQYPDAEGDKSWKAALDRDGLTESELRVRIATQLDLLRLIDERLRPTVNIDSKTIESYYNQELLPQIRESGAAEVPLAEVTPKIKELLTQQKMNQLLLAWLHDLRAGSEILTRVDQIAEEEAGSQAR